MHSGGCSNRRIDIEGQGRRHELRLSTFLCCVMSTGTRLNLNLKFPGDGLQTVPPDLDGMIILVWQQLYVAWVGLRRIQWPPTWRDSARPGLDSEAHTEPVPPERPLRAPHGAAIMMPLHGPTAEVLPSGGSFKLPSAGPLPVQVFAGPTVTVAAQFALARMWREYY
jgi:hypothetical protein